MIETYLASRSAITNYVGSSPSRIYDSTPRQGLQLPWVVVQEMESESPSCLTGASAGRAETRLEVSCYADDREEAYRLAEAVRLELEGFRGDLSGTWVESIVVDGTPHMRIDQPRDKSDTRRWIAQRVYTITHEEAP